MVNLTRDPLPSDTSAPSAISIASISRHLIEPLTGSVKMALRVAACFPRISTSTTDLSGFQPALLSAAARHARLILEIDTKI
jgi:hypothetical protein